MVVIELKNVSKKFRLYHEKTRSLKERILGRSRNVYEELWALKDINLEIKKGETVGIIGVNGSGKTTLLKLIAKILYPTEGEIITKGKIATLIELGAGFHPDLTGRENVYLNGAILRMTKREIDEKFDDIVKFAEIEKFIDIPLRNYSSGMKMRLGFSIAIHVNPDILLVDEVLAVGDAAFKQKCYEKIREFQKQEKTILYVSHNLESVKNLCNWTIWLDKGIIKEKGKPDRVIDAYLSSLKKNS
ncbi:MAG TPA: ABC transporter ATP-binding protein [Firmicutes bacterium]|nr:ABC transporter ATP-binding protein [Bacillota bacterium]